MHPTYEPRSARCSGLRWSSATTSEMPSVCDLTEPVGLSQPTVSHHLKVLADAGFVTRDKRGVWVYYAIVPAAVRELGAHLSEHLLATVDA